MECTNPATVRTIVVTLAKTNSIKEKARPTACKTKEQDLQLVTFLRSEFLQRHISRTFAKKSFFRSTSKWLFPWHYNNLKLTVRITIFPNHIPQLNGAPCLRAHYVLKRTSAHEFLTFP